VHTTHQNVTATLSYPPRYLIFFEFFARERAILVKILDMFEVFASW